MGTIDPELDFRFRIAPVDIVDEKNIYLFENRRCSS
jgi:hypothetical protein